MIRPAEKVLKKMRRLSILILVLLAASGSLLYALDGITENPRVSDETTRAEDAALRVSVGTTLVSDEKPRVKVKAPSVKDGTPREPYEIPLDPKTGFPLIQEKPFAIFNYGFSSAIVTRVEKQEKRSNFVRQNTMLGGYFSMQSVNMQPVNSVLRLSAYYPVYSTFNGMEMKGKQKLVGALDVFAGPMLETDMWKYVQIKGSAGLHFMYQATDEFSLIYLGLGLLCGMELPLASCWTMLVDGTASLDYAGFGTNRNIQPYTASWNCRVDIGARYSRKARHAYSYINSRKR